MHMALSTALHMSYKVRAATLTPVSASISTPVFAPVATVHVISIAEGFTSNANSTCSMGKG